MFAAKSDASTLPVAAKPVFSPVAGTYASAQNVTITEATADATIYYTTSKITPVTYTKYVSGTVIKVSATESLYAYAVATGYSKSAVQPAHYTIVPPLALPAASPDSLGSAITNQGYAGAIRATGGVGPNYFWTVTGLSDGLTSNPSKEMLTISGTPASAGIVSFKVTVKDSSGNTAGPVTYTLPVSSGPNGLHDSYLNGRYVCKIEGYVDGDGARWASLLSILADGKGNFTSGVFDYNSRAVTQAVSGTVTGRYNVGAGNHGLATVTSVWTSGGTGGNTTKWALALSNLAGPKASQFEMIEADDYGPSPSGQHALGTCYAATKCAFTGSASGSNFVFSMNGETDKGVQVITAGRYSVQSGNAATGTADYLQLGSASDVSLTLDNIYTTPDPTTGRLTVSYSLQSSGVEVASGSDAEYIIDSNRAFILETTTAGGVMAGDVRRQKSAANLKGPFVLYHQGYEDKNGVLTGYYSQLLQGSGDGAGNITINQSYTDSAAVGAKIGSYTVGGANGKSAVTFDSAVPGRVTLSTPNNGTRYLYLWDDNFAFEVGMDSTGMDSGVMEDQSQTSFKDATLTGTYMHSVLPRLAPYFGDIEGELYLDAAGHITGSLSEAGEGYFTWFDGIDSSYRWDSTVDGTVLFEDTWLSCAVVSPTKLACINEYANLPRVIIEQQ